VDTEYTYYSWCMTSTDIVKWRKTNDYENFEKRWGSREKACLLALNTGRSKIIPVLYSFVFTCHNLTDSLLPYESNGFNNGLHIAGY
jgi:hypothetical protein